MTAYIKYLRKVGGVTEIRNQFDAPIHSRGPNHGHTIAPFGVHEAHSFTCKHCCRVTFVEAGCDPTELGGRCTCCDSLICKHCVGKPCLVIEKKLDLYERGILKVLR